MEHTPTYTHCDERHSLRVYVVYVGVCFYPIAPGEIRFLYARGYRTYTNIHHIHPDQIISIHQHIHQYGDAVLSVAS
jgi:hypothetical protein